MNVVLQFAESNDEKAKLLAFDIVRWCLEGRLWVDPPMSSDTWHQPVDKLIQESFKGRI